MPDGSIMKDSDHPKGAKKENMSLAPKGKGREAAKKLYKERTKASATTRAKLLKPYNSSTRRATRLKVKNAMSDLDHIAWQFENEFDVKGAMTNAVTKEADRIIKDLKQLERIL